MMKSRRMRNRGSKRRRSGEGVRGGKKVRWITSTVTGEGKGVGGVLSVRVPIQQVFY